MSLLKHEIFPFRVKFNSSQKFLRVAVTHFDPFINKRRIRDYVEVRGAFSQAALAIQKFTKHRLSIVSVDDVPHGFQLENGTFVGIMGKFQRGEIDIFMGPALLSEERFPIVESSTISVSTFTLLTWSPSKIIDPFNFASAFSGMVWASVLITFLLVVMICWAIDRYFTPWRKEPKLSFNFYLWELFSYFFPQCLKTQRAGWFKLCQISFWIAFSLILMISLSSALTSSMTIKREEDFVNNYADVLRFPRVRIFAEAGSRHTQMFTEPQNEFFRNLRTRLSPVSGIFKHGETALHIVSETEARRGVVVASPTICKALILTRKEVSGKCPDVMISSASAGMMCGSVLMSRQLPRSLRSLINKGIATSTEAFLHQQYLKWSMKEVEECLRHSAKDDIDNIKALSIQDIQGCFVLLSIGLSAASLGFLLEPLPH